MTKSDPGRYSVYMHVFPNKKRYVGITGQPLKARWRVNGNGYKPQKLMRRAIEKYRWENIQHIVVRENLSLHEAGALEKKLIAKYKTNDPQFGYNQSVGGENSPIGVKRSEETRRKLSLSHKGKPSVTKGTHLSEKQKQHLRELNLGKKLSDETKKRISEKNKGQKPTSYAIAMAKKACNKPVVFIETGIVYDSMVSASNATQYTASCISAHCRGLVQNQKWRFYK